MLRQLALATRKQLTRGPSTLSLRPVIPVRPLTCNTHLVYARNFHTSNSMSAQEVTKPEPAAEVAAATPASSAPSEAAGTEGDENKPSKKGAKKEAKRLEKLAKAAAKGPAVQQQPSAKKEKKEKEVKKVEEPAEAWVNPTPKGEKKDVSGDMPSSYDPTKVEAAHYDWWEKEGYFKPQYKVDGTPLDKGCFSIVFPPPNVTGNLHIGHALTTAIQDGLIRWKRMQGYTTLFVPGFDHAGIATQAVVENRIMKNEGKTRHDYGREKFLEKVWEWKDQYQANISNQMRRLGGSFEWERAAFTMSEPLSKAVAEGFVDMHKKGLLYRANRLVNWSCFLNTSLSNLEVDQISLTGRTLMNVKGYDAKERFEFGVITSFKYAIENSDEFIIVATTRPETMLGDTAVAVHPEDPRYKHLHGKFVVHPFNGRRIPIVTDAITVDMEFGTGAVKITPAHDPNDFECAVRNNLEFISLMNDDGTYNDNAAPFAGMKRFHVRNAVLAALKEKGLYVEAKDNEMQIPICSRSGDVVEQVMKPQWWISCKPMADEVLARTAKGEIEIKPKNMSNDWIRWMENMQDWCVSRQLWWGHRCPAYLIQFEGEAPADTADEKNWIIATSLEEATVEADKRAAGRKYTLNQDEDVLDTWFSSGLWPFSTMGWPEKTQDLEHFYPNSILETGWDIIFFWVARMVFLGNQLTGKMPFPEVYLHPMVRDAWGRKMSKSTGNVIDPLDVINGQNLQKLHNDLRMGNLPDKEIKKAEDGQKKLFPKGIPQCGTDALRFTLCNYTTGGRDINLEMGRVEGYRKFCNKLWNATKFGLFRLGLVDLEGKRLESSFKPRADDKPTGQEGVAEKWLLHRLNFAAGAVNQAMENRDFSDATTYAYRFFLNDLCDVFIEATKPIFEGDDEAAKASAQNTLYTAIDAGLKLFHPFMPYVTEDLWQRLPRREGDNTPSIMVAAFPEAVPYFNFPEDEADFDLVNDCIRAARSIVGLYNLPTNGKTLEDKITVVAQAKNARERAMLESQAPIIVALTKGAGQALFVTEDSEVPAGCGTETVTADINIHIVVKGKVDASAEIGKLEKKAVFAEQGRDKVVKMTQQTNYETTIPENVRAQNTEKIAKYEAEIDALRQAMERFKILL